MQSTAIINNSLKQIVIEVYLNQNADVATEYAAYLLNRIIKQHPIDCVANVKQSAFSTEHCDRCCVGRYNRPRVVTLLRCLGRPCAAHEGLYVFDVTCNGDTGQL
jgi:hypothetical protein